MINFRCAGCGKWISAEDSRAGQSEACSYCGEVSAVPHSGEWGDVAPVSSEGGGRPGRPGAVKLGLGLYIAHWFFTIVTGLWAGIAGAMEGIREMETSPEPELEPGLIGACCLMALLIPADILGTVMAFLGRAWGAILLLVATVLGYGIYFAMPQEPDVAAPVAMMILGYLTQAAGIASVVCFLLPSAWRYYRESAEYRQLQAQTR